MTDAGKKEILIAEDEPNIASFAKMYLEAAGFRVEVAERGDDALGRIEAERPDLLLLDLNLPGVDGFEVTRRIRQGGGGMPILMLTARDDAVDKVVGLELGADDYVTKPFDPRELVARVRAVMRRTDARAEADDPDLPPVLEVDRLRIEVGPREVFVDGDEVALTPKEFDLLTALVQARGLVLSREQLLEKVWEYPNAKGVETRTVDNYIVRLRQKVEPDPANPRVVVTVRGRGYRYGWEG